MTDCVNRRLFLFIRKSTLTIFLLGVSRFTSHV